MTIVTAIRSVRGGASLDELNGWLSANELERATEYKDLEIRGKSIYARRMVKDENGRCRLSRVEANAVETVDEWHPLVVPLPEALSAGTYIDNHVSGGPA